MYARYPHLPRLAGFQVLAGAISDGTSNLNWRQETFAYAQAHNGESWVGVTTGEHIHTNPSGILIEPSFVPEQTTNQGGSQVVGVVRDESAVDSKTTSVVSRRSPERPTDFYAVFNLDTIRAIRQLGEILEHVVQHLGVTTELTLELRSRLPDGFDDATVRTVLENSTNLNAHQSNFE